MTREELLNEKRKYSALYQQNMSKITERKKYLKANNIPHASDETYNTLTANSVKIAYKISQLKIQIAQMPVEQPKPKPKVPTGTAYVNPRGMFRKLNIVERKLVGMMIAEIGQRRFDELYAIAKEKDVGTVPSNKTWFEGLTSEQIEAIRRENSAEEAKRTSTETQRNREYEAFDRMMRGNYNTYAGENL